MGRYGKRLMRVGGDDGRRALSADALSADPTPAENAEVVNDILQGLSENGRAILRALEKFKYQVSKCSQLTGDDQTLGRKVAQHVEIIDKVMSAMYGVCFSLENTDLTPVYDDRQVQLGDELTYDLAEEVPLDEPEPEQTGNAEDAAPEDTERSGDDDTDTNADTEAEAEAEAGADEDEDEEGA